MATDALRATQALTPEVQVLLLQLKAWVPGQKVRAVLEPQVLTFETQSAAELGTDDLLALWKRCAPVYDALTQALSARE